MGAYCIAQGAHLGVLCWPRWMGWMGGWFRRVGMYACIQLIHFAVLQKLTEHCKTPISSVHLLSCVQLFATPWTAARQASLSITNSWSPPKPMSLSQWCHPIISSAPPALNLSQRQGLFHWVGSLQGGQSTGVSASASVLAVNIQDWSPLGRTGWISLQSKGLSRVFSNTTVQKHQFFGAQLSL